MYEQHQLVKLASMTMPFGKFKGQLLMYLPEEYLLWLAAHHWPNGELGELLALLMDIKTHGSEHLLEPLKQDG